MKGQLNMIDSKQREYQDKFTEKQGLINQQIDYQNQKITKLNVELSYFEEKLGSY